MIATFETSRHQSAASPPVNGGFATESSGRAPSARQRLEEREHVRAVLRVRVRPRRRRLRAEQLVLGDDRRLAAGDADGVVVEALRPRLDHGRVGRLGRRADAVLEVEVVEDGGGALRRASPWACRCPTRPRARARAWRGSARRGRRSRPRPGPLSGMPQPSASAAGAPASAASTARRSIHFTTRSQASGRVRRLSRFGGRGGLAAAGRRSPPARAVDERSRSLAQFCHRRCCDFADRLVSEGAGGGSTRTRASRSPARDLGRLVSRAQSSTADVGAREVGRRSAADELERELDLVAQELEHVRGAGLAVDDEAPERRAAGQHGAARRARAP